MVYIVVILVVLVADLIIKAKILEIPEAGFPIEKFKGKVKIVRTLMKAWRPMCWTRTRQRLRKYHPLYL